MENSFTSIFIYEVRNNPVIKKIKNSNKVKAELISKSEIILLIITSFLFLRISNKTSYLLIRKELITKNMLKTITTILMKLMLSK